VREREEERRKKKEETDTGKTQEKVHGRIR
jgi:hypothetical protein